MRRIAARQPLEPEAGQGHPAAGDARTIGLGQNKARQDEEEIGGQIAVSEKAVHRLKRNRRRIPEMEHDHEEGGDESQGV
ncbi:hypothetical protein D3C78_1933530 [compost metagenome]